MEITDNIKTGKPVISQRNDPSLLIESVRGNIMLKIDQVNINADMEIEKINTDFRTEIEAFRITQQNRYEELIKDEGDKLKNLSAIEIKKKNMDGVELFIKKVIDDTAAGIRTSTNYKNFLIGCVLSAVENVKGRSASVLVSVDDLIYSKDINERISMTGSKTEIIISPDDRVKIGGAIVIDDQEEVIYNNTIERIIYRKHDEIRREIVKIIRESEDEIFGRMVNP